MKTPLVSVIVPCYNVEKYLDKCVESIVLQTYPNLEIWLVDDGATDATPGMIDKWAQKDSRIKVIHKPNGGLSDARNVAIDRATGDYFLFVDSDDYITPDHVEYLLSIIGDSDIALTWCVPFAEGTVPEINDKDKGKVVALSADEALKQMFYQNGVDTSAWGKLYKRELFAGGIRYPKGWLFEDLPTTYRLLLNAKKAVYSPYNTYCYLLRANSIEGSAFSQRKYDSAVSIIEQLEADRDKIPADCLKALNCRLVSFIFHILLQIPVDQNGMRPEMLRYLRKYRKSVVTDNRARTKTRVAALISYFGLPMLSLFAGLGSSR